MFIRQRVPYLTVDTPSLPSVAKSIRQHQQQFTQWQHYVQARVHAPFLKQSNPQRKEEIEKLKEIVEKAQATLISARAIFPFDLFPDSITIDRKKISITHRSFFGIKQTASVQHTDITNVQASIGPIFGSLVITSEHFINNTQTIHYLFKQEAIAIQKLIQGMIIAHKAGVKMDDIGNKELVVLLSDLGCGDFAEHTSVAKL